MSTIIIRLLLLFVFEASRFFAPSLLPKAQTYRSQKLISRCGAKATYFFLFFPQFDPCFTEMCPIILTTGLVAPSLLSTSTFEENGRLLICTSGRKSSDFDLRPSCHPRQFSPTRRVWLFLAFPNHSQSYVSIFLSSCSIFHL